MHLLQCYWYWTVVPAWSLHRETRSVMELGTYIALCMHRECSCTSCMHCIYLHTSLIKLLVPWHVCMCAYVWVHAWNGICVCMCMCVFVHYSYNGMLIVSHLYGYGLHTSTGQWPQCLVMRSMLPSQQMLSNNCYSEILHHFKHVATPQESKVQTRNTSSFAIHRVHHLRL